MTAITIGMTDMSAITDITTGMVTMVVSVTIVVMRIGTKSAASDRGKPSGLKNRTAPQLKQFGSCDGRENFFGNTSLPFFYFSSFLLVFLLVWCVFMKSLEITTKSAKETQKVAALLALEILHTNIKRNGALVIALEGNLGGGKTTFAQGFARGIGIRQKVLSPTFVIMRLHTIRKSHFRTLVHIDAYRIEKLNELQMLGWRDILKDRESIVLVEWADLIQKALPKECIRIRFEFVDEKTRNITLKFK